MFEIGIYYDQDTGRKRWAVYATQSRTWYFPDKYGKAAAQKLCDKMNSYIPK